MKYIESHEELEKKEEELRRLVNSLSESQRKTYYQAQSKKIKDPDTYAALNWFFLGGLHHLYLGKYELFIIELMFSVIALIGFLFSYYYMAGIILFVLSLYELPQLFFSQRIARKYNYNISYKILNAVRDGGTPLIG